MTPAAPRLVLPGGAAVGPVPSWRAPSPPGVLVKPVRLAVAVLPALAACIVVESEPERSSSSGGASSSSSSSSSGGVCAGPNKWRLPPAPPVVNGTRAPSHVSMSALQHNAVVALVQRGAWSSTSFCSGTLINPRFVMTARHCTEAFSSQASAVDVAFGQDETDPLHQVHVAAVTDHPTQDMAILELASDVPAGIAEPVPVIERDLESGDVGAAVEQAGYGVNQAGTEQQSGRWFVVETLFSLDNYPFGDWPGLRTLGVDGHDVRGVCGGDSGGPSFMDTNAGVRVLGALHGGSQNCMGQDYYTRADTMRAWIHGIAGAPGTGCGAITASGQCESGTAVAAWCAGNQVQRDTCGAGRHCGYDGGAGGYRCVDDGSDPCQGVSAFGRCSGQTLQWCAGGQVLTRPCDQCGETCTLVNNTTGYACVSGAVPGTDLGRTCTQDNPCPNGAECLVFASGASTGACAPACNNDDDCAFGGPGTGACLWQLQGESSDFCGILCTASRQCPAGMSAVDEPTSGGSVCVCEVS